MSFSFIYLAKIHKTPGEILDLIIWDRLQNWSLGSYFAAPLGNPRWILFCGFTVGPRSPTADPLDPKNILVTSLDAVGPQEVSQKVPTHIF